MSIDHAERVEVPSLAAETREIKGPRRTIKGSPASLDRYTASAAEAPAADVGLLGAIADGLIVAYEYAKVDGDPPTLALIEKAMLHVGRRLARAIGPGAAGLPCH